MHILLIEDSPTDADLTLRAFRKLGEDHQVELIRDGESAIQYLCRTDRYRHLSDQPLPDIVLLDMILPLRDGLDVLREARANEATRALPIVVLASSGERRDIMSALILGANAYLQKPVAFERLVELLKRFEGFWLHDARLPGVMSE